MPPKKWDEEESDDSSSSSAAPAVGAAAIAARRKFDDEEDDGDVLDSWDADDSEAEREKERKATEVKQKAAAAAAAAKKPKGLRIAQHQAERAQQKAEAEESDGYEETEGEKRERLRRTEQEADLAHAADMFGDIGISANRSKARPATVVVDANDPTKTVDISKLPLFQPKTKLQFETLRASIAPLISANAKSAHYSLFLQDFTKALAKEMNSEQIKKLASSMTALGNEKMREEKAADKGGKKSKAAKTKTSLVTGRANVADTTTYDDNDDFGDNTRRRPLAPGFRPAASSLDLYTPAPVQLFANSACRRRKDDNQVPRRRLETLSVTRGQKQGSMAEVLWGGKAACMQKWSMP
ncbi:hypothetical protein HYE68_006592 [Fusarium pseudograminearum]|nr:hypothetical protein HYE68_006592 [Fusarium pseudograminearum]